MSDLHTPIPSTDERVLAALSHISALLPMMGVIAPIVIWVTQREKSKFVAFQSLQALAYQLVIIVAWILGMGCYMFSIFIIFAGMFIGTATESSGWSEAIMVMTSLSPLFVFGVIILFGLAFISYGVVGAVNVFQGKPFRYIILGERIERYLQPMDEADKPL